MKTDSLGFEQLKETAKLSASERADIAALLYKTDPYIYPAMCPFGAFIQIVSELMESGRDTMFHKRNLFVLRSGGEIAGVLLWTKGKLLWDSGPFLDCAHQKKVRLPGSFEAVNREYFRSYAADTPGIQIINVCIKPSHWHQGLGGLLLRSFLRAHPEEERFELVTLADNLPAVRLYRSAGFRVEETCEGFAVGRRPMCLKMCCQRQHGQLGRS